VAAAFRLLSMFTPLGFEDVVVVLLEIVGVVLGSKGKKWAGSVEMGIFGNAKRDGLTEGMGWTGERGIVSLGCWIGQGLEFWFLKRLNRMLYFG